MTTLELPAELVADIEAEELHAKDGRYRIYATPTDAKPGLFTRATTWASMIEETSRLDAWRARNIASGLAKRPDLIELFIATPEDDKDTLNELVQKAIEAAGGDVRSNRGTAAHGFFARVLAGETLDIPDSIRDDVETALACLKRHGLTPLVDMIEAVLVCHVLQVAGRCDLVCANRDGELVIVDLKTGDGLEEFARLKTAIQLAIYAHADMVYDPATKTHRPMPTVRKDVAFALHRPLGTDTCQLIEVDIVAGWRYASETISAVKGARNHGNRRGGDCLFKVVSDPGDEITAAELLPTEQLRSWVLERLTALDDHPAAKRAMKERWPEDIPRLSSGHQHVDGELRRLADILDTIERDFAIPFGPSDPTVDRTPPSAPEPPPLAPPVDEGERISDEDYDGIVAVLNRLEPDVRATLNGWVAEAHRAGMTFSLKANKTQRRHAIYRALIALAPLVDDDLERVRATVAAVLPDAAQPAVTLGSAIGALTIAEAEQLCDIATAVRADEPPIAYDLEGGVHWATPTTNQTEQQEETN